MPTKHGAQLNENITMIRNWAWTHGDLSINQFKADAGGVFPQREELTGRHLGGIDDGHAAWSIPPGAGTWGIEVVIE